MLCSSRCGQCWCLLSFLFCDLRAGFEAIAVVASLKNVAAVREAIEERGGHLGVAEDRCPFAEAQVCGDDHAGPLIEFAEKMEQKRAA